MSLCTIYEWTCRFFLVGWGMNFRNNLIKQKSKALKAFVGNPQENFGKPVPDSKKNTWPKLRIYTDVYQYPGVCNAKLHYSVCLFFWVVLLRSICFHPGRFVVFSVPKRVQRGNSHHGAEINHQKIRTLPREVWGNSFGVWKFCFLPSPKLT